MTFYSAVMLCVMVSLVILSILVHENERLAKRDKFAYYLTNILIGVSALSEWTGVQLGGKPEISSIFLRFVKCCDYIFTPMAGGVLCLQMRSRNTVNKLLFGTIAANTLFQIVSFFTGWMTKVSADNQYSHGQLYSVYVVIYLIITLLVIIQFGIYGASFK